MFRLLLVSFVALVSALSTPDAMARAQAPKPRVVEVLAERFEFWPSEIVVA
jgi:hypothetical protein